VLLRGGAMAAVARMKCILAATTPSRRNVSSNAAKAQYRKGSVLRRKLKNVFKNVMRNDKILIFFKGVKYSPKKCTFAKI